MDKEKILSASRSENKRGDEMKKLNNMKSAKAGLIAMASVNFFILLFNYFFAGDDLIKVLCPIAAGMSIMLFSDYKLNKKFLSLVLTCLTGIIFTATFLLILFGVSFSVGHVYG